MNIELSLKEKEMINNYKRLYNPKTLNFFKNLSSVAFVVLFLLTAPALYGSSTAPTINQLIVASYIFFLGFLVLIMSNLREKRIKKLSNKINVELYILLKNRLKFEKELFVSFDYFKDEVKIEQKDQSKMILNTNIE